ncbi:protein rep, partial [Salmonella enterica subsp. enterica serovar Kentucky]|nr:protein rep [Salmonella enterica subsp. enterica serovar Kentucky]
MMASRPWVYMAFTACTRFYQSLPKIVADYPDARWMFVTLTVRNCDIADLG